GAGAWHCGLNQGMPGCTSRQGHLQVDRGRKPRRSDCRCPCTRLQSTAFGECPFTLFSISPKPIAVSLVLSHWLPPPHLAASPEAAGHREPNCPLPAAFPPAHRVSTETQPSRCDERFGELG